MNVLVVVGVLALGIGMSLGIWRILVVDQSVSEIDANLDRVWDAVAGLRASHEHHVGVMDRRLRDVEEAASAAQTEARIVSNQLADDNTGVLRRVAWIEQWVQHWVSRSGHGG
jgi:hypothetical protein